MRLALDHLAGALRRDDAVGEALGVAADRGQRRLQLVADREQERALGVLGVAELLRELVERRRELAELRRSLDRERIGALALGEPPARRGDPGHRARDGPREQERDDGGEDGADERGEREPDEERLSSRPIGCARSGAGRSRRRSPRRAA